MTNVMLMEVIVYNGPLYEIGVSKRFCRLEQYVQSNFNGSTTFKTMIISSRQGLFKPTRVDYSARSGGLIVIDFRFSLTRRHVVCSI